MNKEEIIIKDAKETYRVKESIIQILNNSALPNVEIFGLLEIIKYELFLACQNNMHDYKNKDG